MDKVCLLESEWRNASWFRGGESLRAFYFYIDDWLSSKQIEKMDAHEERGYLRLILAAASEDGPPSLPDDDEELAILSKLEAQWWKPTKDRNKRIGETTSGKKLRAAWQFRPAAAMVGRIYNERIYAEWQKQQAAHTVRSQGGKLGNQRRWGDRSAIGERPLSDSLSDHSGIAPTVGVCGNGSSSSKTSLETNPVSKSFRVFWVRWYAITGRKQRESGACQMWVDKVNFETEAAAMACLERYALSRDVANGAIANPDKWIFEQAQDNWSGDWPPARASPATSDRHNDPVLKMLGATP